MSKSIQSFPDDVTAASARPYVQVLLHRGSDTYHTLFGYRIPYLPDFLADHTLLGLTDNERIAEVLSRWTQFVVGLRKWRGTAFALRFLASPADGTIEVVLLGRLTAKGDHTRRVAGDMAVHLAGQLTAFGFPSEPLDQPGLQHALSPFGEPATIVEVRQHEELVPLFTVNQDAYVVHPFWAPAGSWLLPFETMLRQGGPVALSLYLEPTELDPHERDQIMHAAHIAQTLASRNIQTFSGATPGQWRDPQAELIGRVYAALAHRLAEPYLLAIQVAALDPYAAWAVARSVGGAVTAGREALAVVAGEQELPTGFDVRAPRDDVEKKAARECFARLILSRWGEHLATPGKERLVRLVGAKGAAAAFRFPISVRGGVPGIAVRQPAPDFEPGPRPKAAAADELHLGSFRLGGAATVKLESLTRHTLITGFTGAGKTNTVLYLLSQLWCGRKLQGEPPIPFLVIEAAKKEYRGLQYQPGFEELLVFTLGDETTSPFRLNPFELLSGVRVEAHVARLQTCFDAALPQFGILPSIIAEGLESIYRDKGWKLADKGEDGPNRILPTMRDMYVKVIQVAEQRGYAGETLQNIRAAVGGRIGSLLQGSRGQMFACQRSIPIHVLMTRPVVLELNDLNAQDKALTMMFLLMLLREYRELNKGRSLQHVTVVEEAHNVMENVRSVGASEIAADTRAKAVEAFAAMLAEVRAYGEGMIISDQSPEKLAPDAVRNTNLQIAHQLRHRTDREAIAAAMIMDKAQEEYLGKLQAGEAAVFFSGYDRATFIRVPNYKDEVDFREPGDDQVVEHMAAFRQKHSTSYLPFDGCRYCERACVYREKIEPQTLNKELVHEFQAALRQFDERPERTHWPENWLGVAAVCVRAAQLAGHPAALDAAWCYLAHEIDFPFTAHMRREFSSAFERVTQP
ncbi:MAG: ATP-binding protein [Anaerolineae bacterium]|nr:ATP-binding protein [Anaerolineae bacterium]